MERYQRFLNEKAKEKRGLLGTMFFPRTPVLLLDFSNTKGSKDLNFYKDILEGFEAIGLTTLVVLSEKQEKDAKELPQGSHIHYVNTDDQKAAIKAADFALVLNGDTVEVLKNGCVPISQMDGDGTIDYNPLHEKGNGFYFKQPTKWEIFKAIVRALETYQFPYDWENLIREILKTK